MLIDLTVPIPVISPHQCRTSLVARLRVVKLNNAPDTRMNAMWGFDPATDKSTRNLTVLPTAGRYSEGRNQEIQDFLLAPSPAVRWRANDAYSFRLVSAVPAQSKAWDFRVYWVVLNLGDTPNGVPPRIRMDCANYNFAIEHIDYDITSTELPEAANKAAMTRGTHTLWERLHSDE